MNKIIKENLQYIFDYEDCIDNSADLNQFLNILSFNYVYKMFVISQNYCM